MYDQGAATAKIIVFLLLEAEVITPEQHDQIEARMASFIGQSYGSIERRLRDELKDA